MGILFNIKPRGKIAFKGRQNYWSNKGVIPKQRNDDERLGKEDREAHEQADRNITKITRQMRIDDEHDQADRNITKLTKKWKREEDD